MLKRITGITLIVGLLTLSLTAENLKQNEKSKNIDILKDVDIIGWMAYKVGRYPILLKYKNRIEPMKNWYGRTHYPDIYAQAGDDEFAINEAKETHYTEFLNKMESMQVKSKQNLLMGNFTLDVAGTIGKYDFKNKYFVVFPVASDRFRNGRAGSSQYSNTDMNRNLVKSIRFAISPFFLKMEKDDARQLIEKFKLSGNTNRKILLKYKFPRLKVSFGTMLGNNPRPEPWVDLHLSSFQVKDATVTVENINTSELIGVAVPK